jgi:hypothetical protein
MRPVMVTTPSLTNLRVGGHMDELTLRRPGKQSARIRHTKVGAATAQPIQASGFANRQTSI